MGNKVIILKGVIFETQPDPEQFDAYVNIAKSLRPDLEKIDGFVENIRYKSLRRPGWILSLSIWRDEKALVRWRTQAAHHGAQEKGRGGILEDYHLRVGEIVASRGKNLGSTNSERVVHRSDHTEVGEAKHMLLVATTINAQPNVDNGIAPQIPAGTIARQFGFDEHTLHPQLVEWDVFTGLLNPAEHLLLTAWKHGSDANQFREETERIGSFDFRDVSIIRDYGKYDRREAPQFYNDAPGRVSIH